MSLAIVYTRAALGVNAPPITVEVHISSGLPGLTLVGLPETAVKESRDRVRSAIITSGYEFPAKKITINLAPADLPKEGGRYDLPIAIALLAASEQLKTGNLSQYELIGELALTGALRGVSGAISGAVEAIAAGRRIILPAENGPEAGLLDDARCYVAAHLQEVCAFLEGKAGLDNPVALLPDVRDDEACLSEVIGQQQGKRALEITAAGGHNVLLIGPPGTGKTMLAARLPGILPPLSNEEALQSAAIMSLLSASRVQQQWRKRPFRSPHHSASLAAMVGGGSIPLPGEISLAHNGILFLDELPEFERRVLDALREPIESGKVHISRTRAKITYPARFQLIAAMNPSPTGHYQGQHNRCSPEQTMRYLARLSGPFLDRFDLSLEIPLPPAGLLSQPRTEGERSAEVKKRVIAARDRQMARQGRLNALLGSGQISEYCALRNEDAVWLEETLVRLGLSIRAWQRLLKVSRTIADLAGVEQITRAHLQEALGYRAVERLLAHLQKMIA
ncbi:YifB family Mg chelatase-like AAA ATPase [Pluralibacter gergoviae]|uniref:YifB family Mg chelatase-like AAA ATPase n=1 Tax=Pluralibacter gergoviae TaxID=61647 RepID=UPI0006520D47|nr:YifB family Mg chelatase-like AAA ATPase [Pluralibacter gergoviae]EKV0931654.1 YifB family Mg chelatase-like AAA ATPase [Pluralibacter gergoviae]EKV6248515.1 YifB family Mg chelatase-like AAA ATPase [Pluralibacter gergoviae]EKW9967426.1 YifB family Mg chelatase-like AAA ATPase [Pluralibacter gergoviae]ELD4273093.1 YifB family Mg chelatase-like AAA ATPase [Pluralibacter gergoviae]ELD4278647.1 YifB family Mg chelatase-like AAA ATPase [Pluralibacter gergoviae]